MSSGISPRDLGLPDKYQSWRKGQWEAIEQTSVTEKKFVANNGPTGFGKSVYYRAASILNGGRSMTLTANKTLQDQLVDDFPDLFDMRGRQNYSCVSGKSLSCAEGRILGCKDPSCRYLIDRQAFLDSNAASTNYSYYLSTKIHSDGCGKIDLLNCDEAHLIDKEICAAVEIHLEQTKYHFMYDVLGRPPEDATSVEEWKAWAASTIEPAKAYLKTIKENSGKHRWLVLTDSYISILTRIATMADDWLIDQSAYGKTIFAPLWPTAHTDKLLFNGAERVILVSATLVPKTLALLNIAADDCLFLSQPYTFDSNRCPVYLFGPCFVDFKTTPDNWVQVIARLDSIIDHRLDRKGIIHPTSYDRQAFILSQSRHAHLMIAPTKASELPAALKEFRESPAPRILISPSITTGYDFPGSQAEYQILMKVPFIDTRPPIMKARSKADPEYVPYLVAQTLVQTCGRIMRGPEDLGETFILDRHANRFLGSVQRGGYPHLVPDWFHKQLRWPSTHPNPPPPLYRA